MARTQEEIDAINAKFKEAGVISDQARQTEDPNEQHTLYSTAAKTRTDGMKLIFGGELPKPRTEAEIAEHIKTTGTPEEIEAYTNRMERKK